jgi:hypothetical protein
MRTVMEMRRGVIMVMQVAAAAAAAAAADVERVVQQLAAADVERAVQQLTAADIEEVLLPLLRERFRALTGRDVADAVVRDNLSV